MGRRTWIKIYSEKWLRGSIRKEKPEVRGIWVDILTLAADSAYGDEGVISLAPGCGLTDKQIHSMLNITPEMWTKIKKRLIKTDRIIVNGTNEMRVINWKKYQSEYSRQRPYRQKVTTKVTSESAGKSAPQSNREKEKEKENNTSSPKLKFTDKDMKLVKELETLIKEVDPKHKFAGGRRREKWANTFRLMRRQDHRTIEDIRVVMKSAFSDSFWSTVIQSADGFREHYNQLRAKMLGGKSNGKKAERSAPYH